MLHVDSLVVDYHDTPLLNGVTFSLVRGALLHLRGGNGQGKTTLLKLLAGLIKPTEGDIKWNDQPIHDDLPSYQQLICYVGHKMGLSPQLTVIENCLLDPHWQGEKEALMAQLARFELTNIADKPCYQLSAGQRRRVALFRLAITNKPLWLLDEPLTALDNTAIVLLIESLKQHLNNNGLVVLTSHQPLPIELGQHTIYTL